MNRNQLEKLNKVLKSVIEKSTVNPKIEELNRKIATLNAELMAIELKQDKTFDDKEDIRVIKRDIDYYNKAIEEERQNPTIKTFKPYKYVRKNYINELVNEYKKKDRQLQELISRHYCYNLDYHEFGFDITYKKLHATGEEIDKIVKKYTEEAEKVVKAMEETGEFDEYYLIHSGKQEYDNKMKKLELVKSIQSKLEEIINDYAIKFAMLTIDDFRTYVSLWNEYLNEPCEVSFDALYKIKYLGKMYEVYKYEVEGSVLHNRVQCCTIDGIRKDLTNIYLKEIKMVEITDVKPIDVITYKGETYEVYKMNVAGSEFYKRVKAKSTISNKTRDFKNFYLKKI